MRKFVAPSILGLSLSLLGTLAPAPAQAHFKLNAIDDKMDVSWMSQNAQGAPQKTGPCAAVGMGASDPAGTPTGKVTDVKAGQMVSIAVEGTVGHPGWYRVSLIEGPSSSQTLTTLPDPKLQTKCTATMINNPVWSSTQPVIGDALPAGSTATTNQSGTATLKVMIPQNANCTTAKPCTLQVVMIMTDHSPPDCFYHHCADITITGGSTSGGGGAGGGASASGGAGGRAAAGGATGSAGAGGGTTTASGGTSGSGGVTASGGVSGSGGATASGGASASGGATSSGGSSASGGATSSGGALASGGTTGSGGKTSSSGGTTGSGGSASPSGSGGAGTGADNSSGGCAVAAGRGEAALLPVLAVLLLVARARRRGARP